MSLNYDKSLNEEIREWLIKVSIQAEVLSRTSLFTRSCPVCDSMQSAPFVNNGSLAYTRCAVCSLVFMNPALDPSRINQGFQGEDDIVMEYFRIRSRHRELVVSKPDPEQDRQLQDIFKEKKTGRLLDVGCSFGDFLRKAAHFYQVEGVEVNPFTSEVVAREFMVHRDYLQKLNLAPVFDIVTLHQILYGVPDPIELFKEIRKILKPGGILYVNTPNADSYAMQLYQGKANHVYGYTTQNVFNRKSIAALAEKTGFRIRSFRTEWLDIYLADLLVYLGNQSDFIHKKNSHIPGYEDSLRREDEFHDNFDFELGDRGNYLVAILEMV